MTTHLMNRSYLIKFSSYFFQVAEMMKYLRVELLSLLEEKIRDPCLNLLNHDNGKRIISTIIKLITKE